ncbi:MAG: phosphatidylserine/phosphatidylglycerophosphate/cardiolipin synthase family protein [Armatimonadetes bacterium]|nr:phosphatidylserine/phosphatidylglycerophosphate/cardiolipin synthase family protein [Armatimonadota bacterium]
MRQAFESIVDAGGPGKARLLVDNVAAWNARWHMLDSARHEINAQYFIWDRDVFGMATLGHIYKKVRNEHLNARIMVDATGDTWGTKGFKSHIGGKDYLQELVATGNAEARIYHPHYKKLIDQALHMYSSYVAASNHDKILEVDGLRGMTGGRNIAFEYLVSPLDCEGAWRDTDVLIEGKESAQALRTAFEVEFDAPWINSTVHPDLLGNWVKRDLELIGAYVLMDDWLKGPALGQAEKTRLRTSETAREALSSALVKAAIERLPAEGMDRAPGRREWNSLKKMALELVSYPELRGSYGAPPNPTHEAEIRIIDKTSVVGAGQDTINRSLLALVRAAEHRIVIENPYVVLTEDMVEAFREAGKKGVEIWLGTNSPTSTDSDVTQAFFLKDWPKLLAVVPNLHVFVATGQQKLHAKVATIDDKISLVSSYNLDFLSRSVNSEIGAVIWSPEFAKETFDSIVADHKDPRNGCVEYRIRRDPSGAPVRSDGKPVLDAEGNLLNSPDIEFGPDQHVPKELMESYRAKMDRWSWLRRHIPQLHSLETLEEGGRSEFPILRRAAGWGVLGGLQGAILGGLASLTGWVSPAVAAGWGGGLGATLGALAGSVRAVYDIRESPRQG